MSTDVRTYFVYCLFDPDVPDIARYVGSTPFLARRYKQHLKADWGVGGFVTAWTKSIVSFGRIPQIALLDVVRGTRSEAVCVEWSHIHQRKKHLFNGATLLADARARGLGSDDAWAYMQAVDVAARLRLTAIETGDDHIRDLAFSASLVASRLQHNFPDAWITQDSSEWTNGMHALCNRSKLERVVRKWRGTIEQLADLFREGKNRKTMTFAESRLAATLTQGARS